MLITLNSSSLSDPKGFIGDIDEVAVFDKVLSPTEIAHQYAVARNSPNEYVELLKNQSAEGIYSFEDIGPVISGLKKDGPGYNDIKLWLSAACEESPSFLINPANNKIQFVIMDSDSSPRDQIAVQNDDQLDGDEQLMPTGTPYQGVLTLEWNNEFADLTFESNGSVHVWDGINVVPNLNYSLRFSFDGQFASIELIRLAYDGEEGWQPEAEVFQSDRFPLELRLRGGVGWASQLVDHEAGINKIFVEDVQFAEYRSTPFRSRTPYYGAQIFKSGTPSHDLVAQFAASDWGGQINFDNTKVASDKAYKVSTTGEKRFEGIRTQRFWVQNPKDLVVSLRVISGVTLEMFLYDYETDTLFPIHTHNTLGPDWIEIEKTVSLPRASNYALYVTSASFGQWFVDEISVKSASIDWSARQDENSVWMPLKNLADRAYAGVVFDYPGKGLQVKGISKVIDGQIKDVQVQPKYAELGAFAWRDKV